MTIAVIVMSYGSPTSPDDIEAFYTDVRHGRPPSPEALSELESRYEAIGGVSPLEQRSRAQVDAISQALHDIAPGRFTLYYGTKHGAPSIEAAVASATTDGASALIGVVLAPHYSAMSVGEYLQRLRVAAEKDGLRLAVIERYGSEPELVELLASRVTDALRSLPWQLALHAEVLFSAHSLPARILETDDRYPAELAETAALVAERADLLAFRTAWQSAGRTDEPWLGPDISEVLTELAGAGTSAVVVCPAGFTSDHLEILYDLDIVAARRASELGLVFVRTASLNDDALFAELLARRILDLEDLLDQPQPRSSAPT